MQSRSFNEKHLGNIMFYQVAISESVFKWFSKQSNIGSANGMLLRWDYLFDDGECLAVVFVSILRGSNCMNLYNVI